jgi:hypothetical protein
MELPSVTGLFFLIAIVVSLAWLGSIASRLSTDQPHLYNRLGHPLIPGPRVIASQLRWLWFLYSGACRHEINNPHLVRSCSFFLAWYSVTLLVFLTLFGILLFVILRAASTAA